MIVADVEDVQVALVIYAVGLRRQVRLVGLHFGAADWADSVTVAKHWKSRPSGYVSPSAHGAFSNSQADFSRQFRFAPAVMTGVVMGLKNGVLAGFL
jgi:hypothetical protein